MKTTQRMVAVSVTLFFVIEESNNAETAFGVNKAAELLRPQQKHRSSRASALIDYTLDDVDAVRVKQTGLGGSYTEGDCLSAIREDEL